MGVNFRLAPEQASTIAPAVDMLYWFLVGMTVFFTGLIFILILYFAIKYRRRPGNVQPQHAASAAPAGSPMDSWPDWSSPW